MQEAQKVSISWVNYIYSFHSEVFWFWEIQYRGAKPFFANYTGSVRAQAAKQSVCVWGVECDQIKPQPKKERKTKTLTLPVTKGTVVSALLLSASS